jgi:hypothetical protein
VQLAAYKTEQLIEFKPAAIKFVCEQGSKTVMVKLVMAY